MCVLPTDVVVNASLLWAGHVDNYAELFRFLLSYDAMLLAITPAHSELGNRPAIYPLLTCAWKYW